MMACFRFPDRDACYNGWYAGFMQIGYIPPGYAINLCRPTVPFEIPAITNGLTLPQIRILQIIAASRGVAVATATRIGLRNVGVGATNLGPHSEGGYEYAFSGETSEESPSTLHTDIEVQHLAHEAQVLLQVGETRAQIATELSAETMFGPEIVAMVIGDTFRTVFCNFLQSYFRSRHNHF